MMSRRTIAAILGLQALWCALLVGALVDRRWHQENTIYGVNQWGYRAEARGSKRPGELRVAILGGSAAFERGLAVDQTLAEQLFFELRQAGAPRHQSYTIANLSEPRAGADTYVDALRDYRFVQADAVCIFDGYDTLEGVPPHGRRRSLVFRTTGYLPRLSRSLFGLPEWMSDQDGGVAEILRDDGVAADVTCEGASRSYCDAIVKTVTFGLAEGYPMLHVSPPSVSRRHLQQQRSLAERLRQTFRSEPRFIQLDLTAAIDWSNPEEVSDRIHRTGIGNHVVGQRIATTLLQWPAFMGRRR
jgi:hypothetical protein